jgi:hypothetical protein
VAVRSDRRVVGGLIQIAFGVGLLALQMFEGLGGSSWLLLLGALFLVGYFARRAYGFLVAGGILFGIGLGQLEGSSSMSVTASRRSASVLASFASTPSIGSIEPTHHGGH